MPILPSEAVLFVVLLSFMVTWMKDRYAPMICLLHVVLHISFTALYLAASYALCAQVHQPQAWHRGRG